MGLSTGEIIIVALVSVILFVLLCWGYHHYYNNYDRVMNRIMSKGRSHDAPEYKNGKRVHYNILIE